MSHPKKISFLSFGALHPTSGLTNSAPDALRQTVELAVAAEEVGIDGASYASITSRPTFRPKHSVPLEPDHFSLSGVVDGKGLCRWL
jgi:hypothetical protein